MNNFIDNRGGRPIATKISRTDDLLTITRLARMKTDEIEEIVIERLKKQPNPKAYYQAMYKAFWQHPRIQNAFESAYQKYSNNEV